MLFYLDESGDLGWKFDAPYRRGGSSRHLTIATLCVSPSKKHLPKRVVRNLYKKFKWPPGVERKWAEMTSDERNIFMEKAVAAATAYPDDIKYLAITVKKEQVAAHIRQDENKLYNYMIGLSLVPEMAKHDAVQLFPDERSIKVGSGNSLHDYLQIKLWFDKEARTKLTTQPSGSSNNLSIQFSDMLAGAVQSHFENGKSEPWNKLRSLVEHKCLFFTP